MSLVRIAVLATGDELLSGKITDTNTRDIARLLGPAGYRLSRSLCIPDAADALAQALRQLIPYNDVIITTGGLGSTGDDLTAKSVAQALGRPLEENTKAVELIRKRYAERGRELDPLALRQALFPHKAVALPNPEGTAPGFWLRQQGCDLFFLPGVPSEMRAMLTHAVVPALQRSKPGGTPRMERVFGFFGLSEPQVEAKIPYTELPPGVEVAFSLEYPLVQVTLRCATENAEENLDTAEALLTEMLGDFLVARDAESMAEHVGNLLRRTRLTVALAESCTGGLISHMLTSVAGASDFFQRGAITYADKSKIDWLGVSAATIAHEGAVSATCAEQMARGLRERSGVDLALSVTGIAGPGGGSEEKPVGTVFLALSSAQGTQSRGYLFHGERHKVQKMSACMALEWLRRFAIESLADD